MSKTLPSMEVPPLLESFAGAQIDNRDREEKNSHNNEDYISHGVIPLNRNRNSTNAECAA
jgi:hypothetical protein